MEIRILKLLEGASQAEGLTVIIDVFRAFTAECFMFEKGVEKVFAVGKVEDCFALKQQHPEYVLAGERGGKKIDGFDFGNSPSQIAMSTGLCGKTVVHTTSAGVQGIVTAKNATEIISGSLVNAKAIAKYIKSVNPQVVSLVCMGLDGKEDTDEDILCAEYIKALLEGKNPNVHKEIAHISLTSGHKFFEEDKREAFPEPDFFMCLVPDIFNFVIKAEKKGSVIEMNRVTSE